MPEQSPSKPTRRRRQTNWEAVDLTRPTAELIAELGVTRQAVSAARRKRGIQSPDGHGGARPRSGFRLRENYTLRTTRAGREWLEAQAAAAGCSSVGVWAARMAERERVEKS